MELIDLPHRPTTPIPWAEGEKIPWDEPGFSQRMLREHLSQAHDAASRRLELVARHVGWIQATVLSERPSKILDLGCGPGLYTSQLARLGHACVGIDFSPASVAYAADQARQAQLQCTYLQQDIRTADYGAGYDLAMLIFGEFNTFRPRDARLILEKAHQALAETGRLLLEVHTAAAVYACGDRPATWYASAGGLFSAGPHLCLMENFRDDQQDAITERYFVIDAATGKITHYASSMQAYTDDQYRSLLEACGFVNITFHPSLGGDAETSQRDYVVIVAQKPPAP